MVNKVILIGNVGGEPEIKNLDSGATVANVSLATNETFKDKNGEKQTRTEWHNIVFWGALAGIVESYVKKGNKLYIEGKIQSDTWEDDNGNKRKTVKIRAFNMTMLGGESEQTQTPTPQTEQKSDDLPF